MSDKHRAISREIAQKHFDDDDPLGWFEDLYSHAGDKFSIIPWADLIPNSNIVDWLNHIHFKYCLQIFALTQYVRYPLLLLQPAPCS